MKSAWIAAGVALSSRRARTRAVPAAASRRPRRNDDAVDRRDRTISTAACRAGRPRRAGAARRLPQEPAGRSRAGRRRRAAARRAATCSRGRWSRTSSEGAPVVAAYNALGYTAAAVGNHEFDFGPAGPAATPRSPDDDPSGALKSRAAEAQVPVSRGEPHRSRRRERAVGWPNVSRQRVVECRGACGSGIIGVMTRGALTATIASNVRVCRSRRSPKPSARMRRALRATGRRRRHRHRACGRPVHAIRPARGSRRRAIRTARSSRLRASCPPDWLMPSSRVIVTPPSGTRWRGSRSPRRIRTGARSAGSISSSIARRRKSWANEAFRQWISSPGEYEGRPVMPDAAIERVLAPALEAVRLMKSRPIGVVLDDADPPAGADVAAGTTVRRRDAGVRCQARTSR